MTEWNPRYSAYARSHRLTEEEMLASDKARLPGACMMEFVFWMNARWREWERDWDRRRWLQARPDEVRRFDAWLWRQALYRYATHEV